METSVTRAWGRKFRARGSHVSEGEIDAIDSPDPGTDARGGGWRGSGGHFDRLLGHPQAAGAAHPTGGAANWQGNSNPTSGGAPVNRTTGNPPLYDQKGNPTTGGPLGSTSNGTAADNTMLPSPPSKSNDLQPIATNGPKQTSGIRPVSRTAEGPGNVDDPLQLPLHESAAPTGPAVTPISAQPLDGQPKVRSAPPQIPVDSLEPTAPPKPSKPGTLLPPITTP